MNTKNKDSNVAGYKVDLQKPIVFLYTKTEKSGNEINKTILFIT